MLLFFYSLEMTFAYEIVRVGMEERFFKVWNRCSFQSCVIAEVVNCNEVSLGQSQLWCSFIESGSCQGQVCPLFNVHLKHPFLQQRLFLMLFSRGTNPGVVQKASNLLGRCSLEESLWAVLSCVSFHLGQSLLEKHNVPPGSACLLVTWCKLSLSSAKVWGKS